MTDLLEAFRQSGGAGHQVTAAHVSRDGADVISRPRWSWHPPSPRVTLGGVLLAAASVLLAALAVTQGYVSWHQQDVFDLTARPGQVTAAALEALGLDAAALIFAVLGVALARLGRPARTERLLVAACAAGSMIQNLLGANLGSPRSVAVYVLPPVLFAATADRLIAVIHRAALGPADTDAPGRRSVWHLAGVVVLYGLRLVLAPVSTPEGIRRLILAAAPLPGADPRSLQLQARADTAPASHEHSPPDLAAGQPSVHRRARTGKTARLLDLAAERHDLAAVPLPDVAGIAGTLAAEVDLHPGTARRELLAHVRQLQAERGCE